MERRKFLKAVAAGFPAIQRGKASPNDKLVIACMGVRGRAAHLMRDFASMPEIEVAMLCDIDSRLLPGAVSDVEQRNKRTPKTTGDFRRALDDKSIDAIVIGTPDHWHAIPTILACQAGKHVYVEKPCSHNIREGEVMLAAARKYNRVVQVGIQSRSAPHLAEACDYIRSGAIGRVTVAKGWETAKQRPLATTADSAPPAGVDYDMWLGPAPKRPFNANRFHSNWRWFFDYGTGDLGNDGVHRIDYARRGLAAGLEARGLTLAGWPSAVSASGGKLGFDDAQEFADTLMVTWEYPGAMLMYEMRIWSPTPMEGAEEGAIVYGDGGAVVITNEEWFAYGPKGVVMKRGEKSSNAVHDPAHKRNFLESIRNGSRPACDIEIGHAASSLTHMGNIAWRVNRKLHWKQGRFEEQEANRFLGRSYRAPWSLPAI